MDTHGCGHGCHSVGVRVGSGGWGAGSQEVLFRHHVCSGYTQNWFTGGSTVPLSTPLAFPFKETMFTLEEDGNRTEAQARVSGLHSSRTGKGSNN